MIAPLTWKAVLGAVLLSAFPSSAQGPATSKPAPAPQPAAQGSATAKPSTPASAAGAASAKSSPAPQPPPMELPARSPPLRA
ncbi:hypothetical protein ACLESO_32460 [Pyxidicoccus sp. 3LG]